MSYRQCREETIYECAMYGIPRWDTFALLSLANRRQVSNEIECSIPESDEQRAKRGRRDEIDREKLEKITTRIGWTVEEGGDPRGSPLILTRGAGQGMLTIRFPGRGLPARCFA